jgi:hypothetical protein
MERHLQADLSATRIHTDAQADTLSRSVRATAFTVGSDVFFSEGTFDPNSGSGRELLAHELTHVVQQSGQLATGPAASPAQGPAQVSHPDDPAEVQARAVGRAVAETGPGLMEVAAAGPPFFTWLQATAGNQAVARLVDSLGVTRQDDPGGGREAQVPARNAGVYRLVQREPAPNPPASEPGQPPDPEVLRFEGYDLRFDADVLYRILADKAELQGLMAPSEFHRAAAYRQPVHPRPRRRAPRTLPGHSGRAGGCFTPARL